MIWIDGYPIDLAISEGFEAETELTQYPIEKGGRNTDHMRNLPFELTFEGVVSDTPIGAVAVEPSRTALTGDVTPSKDAYTRLIAIRDALEPVEIICSLGKFESMGLTHLSIPRTKETGKALIFTVTFQRMDFVTNNRTTVKVSIPNGGGRANLGNKESQQWAKNFKLPGRRFVITFRDFQRATLAKSGTYGKPILTTTHLERLQANSSDDYQGESDHYEILGGATPDGYVDAFYGKSDQGEGLFPAGKNVYHRFRIQNTSSDLPFKGQTAPRQDTINGRNVHYDHANHTWVDDENGQVVRKVQSRPGQPGYMDDKWRGVTYGSNLPGGGIPSGGS